MTFMKMDPRVLTLCVFLYLLTPVKCRYDDISPTRLTLIQTSQSTDLNGVISGNCPDVTYPIDYALIWFEGATRYYRATGDKNLLSDLFPAAQKCMDYFLSASCYGSKGFEPHG